MARSSSARGVCCEVVWQLVNGSAQERRHKGFNIPGKACVLICYLCLEVILSCLVLKFPPWPSGLKRWNQTLVPVVRARFEPRCGRPPFAPTRSGVRVCGRNRTEAREREWAEGTVSSLPGTLNVRIKFCHSTGIVRSGGGVRAGTTSYA